MASAAGRALGWGVLAALGAAVACLPDPPEDDTSKQIRRVLEAVGPHVVVPTLEVFEQDLEALRLEVVAWQEGGARADVTSAYFTVMDTWQILELFQLGPAGSSLTAIGGQDLRDEIYSWPTVNPCLVDQITVGQDYLAPDFFPSHLVNAYGLDALEHLLLAPEVDNVCPSQVDINATGSWDALTPAQIDTQRAAYAQTVVDGVLATTATLRQAWDPAGGDFSGQLSEQGTEGLNAVFDALFYLETITKDRKLAEPLGLGTCTAECVDLVESLGSGESGAWVGANLQGFIDLFTGREGPGLQEILDDLGHEDLSARILANAEDAQQRALSLGPIEAALVTNAPAVQDLYDAIKAVTDDLKGDVATVLVLTLPNEAAGDND